MLTAWIDSSGATMPGSLLSMFGRVDARVRDAVSDACEEAAAAFAAVADDSDSRYPQTVIEAAESVGPYRYVVRRHYT